MAEPLNEAATLSPWVKALRSLIGPMIASRRGEATIEHDGSYGFSIILWAHGPGLQRFAIAYGDDLARLRLNAMWGVEDGIFSGWTARARTRWGGWRFIEHRTVFAPCPAER